MVTRIPDLAMFCENNAWSDVFFFYTIKGPLLLGGTPWGFLFYILS